MNIDTSIRDEILNNIEILPDSPDRARRVDKKYKILSVDGGGVRGLASIEYLCLLETDLGIPLYEYFDGFTGVSIGSIIICACCILKMKMCEIKKLFSKKNINEIFDASCLDNFVDLAQFCPKYDGINKKRLIENYFSGRKLGETCGGKLLVVPTYDMVTRSTRLYNSIRDSTVDISELINSATSATAYFPYETYKSGTLMGKSLVDSGLNFNNPTLGLVAYARKYLKIKMDNFRILSVGTGAYKMPIYGMEDSGGLQYLKSGLLLDLTMDDSSYHKIAKYMFRDVETGKDNYLRINTKINRRVELDDNEEHSRACLQKMGEIWWDLFKNKTIELLVDKKCPAESEENINFII